MSIAINSPEELAHASAALAEADLAVSEIKRAGEEYLQQIVAEQEKVNAQLEGLAGEANQAVGNLRIIHEQESLDHARNTVENLG